MTDIQILDHNNADIDAYYYHIEQQKNLLDDMHYRVMSGGHTGYYYNPYYANSNYPYNTGIVDGYYGYSPYGTAHTYVGSVGHGVHSPANADSHVHAADEEEVDELSAGEIAGIVIGSVAGFLLLVLLACLCMQMRRRNMSNMPPQGMQGMGAMPPNMNTSMSDATGNQSDAPDILDYTGGKKPPAAMDGTMK